MTNNTYDPAEQQAAGARAVLSGGVLLALHQMAQECSGLDFLERAKDLLGDLQPAVTCFAPTGQQALSDEQIATLADRFMRWGKVTYVNAGMPQVLDFARAILATAATATATADAHPPRVTADHWKQLAETAQKRADRLQQKLDATPATADARDAMYFRTAIELGLIRTEDYMDIERAMDAKET